MKLDIPYYKQEKTTTCGPACVRMIAAHNGTVISEAAVEEVCETSWLGNTCEELASGAKKLGFEAVVVENMSLKGLEYSLEAGVPIIALLDSAMLYDGIRGFGHFVLLIGMDENVIWYHDPDLKKDLSKSADVFMDAWARYAFGGVKIWKSTKK